jgi:hypothetical protein
MFGPSLTIMVSFGALCSLGTGVGWRGLSRQPAHRGAAFGMVPADWSREARPDLRKGGVT